MQSGHVQGAHFGIFFCLCRSKRYFRQLEGGLCCFPGARLCGNAFIFCCNRFFFGNHAGFDFGDGMLRCLCTFFGQLFGQLFGSRALTRQLRDMLFGLQFLRFDLCRLRLTLGVQFGRSNRFLGQFHSGGRSVAGACFHGNALVVGRDRLLFCGLACFSFGDRTLCCLCAFFGQLPGLLFSGKALALHCSGTRFGLQPFRFSLRGLRLRAGMQFGHIQGAHLGIFLCLGRGKRFFRKFQGGFCSLPSARLHGNAFIVSFDRLQFGRHARLDCCKCLTFCPHAILRNPRRLCTLGAILLGKNTSLLFCHNAFVRCTDGRIDCRSLFFLGPACRSSQLGTLLHSLRQLIIDLSFGLRFLGRNTVSQQPRELGIRQFALCARPFLGDLLRLCGHFGTPVGFGFSICLGLQLEFDATRGEHFGLGPLLCYDNQVTLGLQLALCGLFSLLFHCQPVARFHPGLPQQCIGFFPFPRSQPLGFFTGGQQLHHFLLNMPAILSRKNILLFIFCACFAACLGRFNGFGFCRNAGIRLFLCLTLGKSALLDQLGGLPVGFGARQRSPLGFQLGSRAFLALRQRRIFGTHACLHRLNRRGLGFSLGIGLRQRFPFSISLFSCRPGNRLLGAGFLLRQQNRFAFNLGAFFGGFTCRLFLDQALFQGFLRLLFGTQLGLYLFSKKCLCQQFGLSRLDQLAFKI
ncbi:hypothetical protein RHDC1_01092 [Rhodocyclaceae bacterium]|nr:hypothetical protein RHDC1_01092 [Rhodocyclaceae bacterium]